MAYNRKMRKFEGTCYIPGEQLAMMAKYYRGANLNLNLTLYEEDFATMQETLDQACWCSKLDELDRMKMSHMKGNEWRIQHERCLEEAQQGGGRNPEVYPALPQSSRSAVGKVERGTSAVSLYDRERGVVRGGRYQRDDYSEPRNRRDDNYGRQNRWDEYNDRQHRRGYYTDPRNAREDHDVRYRREDNPGSKIYHTEVFQNEKRAGRNMGGPPDKKYDMESEAAMSSMPEAHGDIRCAVCNLETCLVCKNHLYSSICQCKCTAPNAGLCNKCTEEPCKEEEQVGLETGGNKMDMSSMMLTMMMSSMFKQSQAPESICCCKPSRDHSESCSSDSSNGKVHKVYLYEREDPKKNKNSKKKYKKASSDSSSACDCCKCSRKYKKNSDRKRGGPKTSGEETSESDAGQKHQSAKGKGSKDLDKKPKREESSSDSDPKPKGSKESTRKSTAENGTSKKRSKEDDGTSKKSSKEDDGTSKKRSKEDDAKSTRSENMKTLKMMNESKMITRTNKGKTLESKAHGSIDSRNVQFSNTEQMSPMKTQRFSSFESDSPKKSPSPQKSPPNLGPRTQISELLDSKRDPDHEIDYTKKDGNEENADGVEESSTTFSLKEFMVCLPKMQSNLQGLMYKLNQMALMNNQLQLPQIDPSLPNAQLHNGPHHDVPLLSSPQNPHYQTPGFFDNGHPQLYNQYQKQDSEISIGYSPSELPVQNFPPTISPGSLKGAPKLPQSFKPPTKHHSTVNFPKLGETPESMRMTTGDRKPVPRVNDIAESTNLPMTLKFSQDFEGRQTRNINKGEDQWPFNERELITTSPALSFSNIDQSLQQSYFKSAPTTRQMHNKKQPGKINYQKVKENNLNTCPLPNVFSLGGSPNVEIIELTENKSHDQYTQHRKPARITHKEGAALKVSRNDGETIFQSYNNETSADISNQDITDYASFTDEKMFQLSPATSAEKTSYQLKNQNRDTTQKGCSGNAETRRTQGTHNRNNFSKYSQNKHEEHGNRSVLKTKKGVTFKAKQRNPLSLEKLVQGYTQKGKGGSQATSLKSYDTRGRKSNSGSMPKMIFLDQGVGPGKFRQSKSDTSLELLTETLQKTSNTRYQIRPSTSKTPNAKHKLQTLTSTFPAKDNAVIPLKRKRLTSPINEKARYTMATKRNILHPKRNESKLLSKVGLKNMLSDQTTESNSMFKMSDAYAMQELDSQSFIVSSVEVKTINDHKSSPDIYKMVQGIASTSLMNVTNQTLRLSTDAFDIIPLLPLSSTTPTDGPESKSEIHAGALAKTQVSLDNVSFDNEFSPNTPSFLRKSKVQVEQLKRAHETIRSMIKNVNDVIAHIDSDSKIGIKSKRLGRDKEKQPEFFLRCDDDDEVDRKSQNKSQERTCDLKHFESQVTKPMCSDIQNREVQKMFLSVNRVINSVITPSEESNVAQGAQCSSENTTPSRAHRDFFILNSESSSTAFTESLRRSLENDTSRSVPLVPVPPPQQATSQRDPRTTRKLRRRSWFPQAKK